MFNWMKHVLVGKSPSVRSLGTSYDILAVDYGKPETSGDEYNDFHTRLIEGKDDDDNQDETSKLVIFHIEL